ncbi:UDP-N-acetylglucosamine--N-acetylmuramyl-(pentapeptide) pyrophosphoryl-undecaprenol N-acetylglucosamine transferase [Patescibacteria group bacterium]|nr:UDP-N-acetylglucosamine--N-acetylmuramyl-(pentapeptide) pyrophosphoryl-undecaprenol N-acetylglucosamine transferase [Patescibacteria group bacterium]
MKILFTGGGTGGHIFPIIAVCREIRRIYPEKNLKFLYLGPKDELSSDLLSQEGIKVKIILAGKIRRYLGVGSFFLNLIDILFKIPLGIIQAFLFIFFSAPDLIFSKGGYGSIPTVISGWFLGVPIFLHESDIAPGLSNRFLSRFALEIFVSFPRTEYFSPKKMILVGNPIRREVLEGSKKEARELFKLNGKKPLILILGGSQGAQRINDVISVILPEILKDFELIHQAGTKNFKAVKKEIEVIVPEGFKKYYHLFPFLKEEELKQAYQACDLIVGRAGSGTIFEISALGKPSILIPLPEAAQNHQVKNAYSFAQNEASLIIEEINFTPHFFLERIKYLFSHPSQLEKMGKLAKEFSKPRAAKIIAEYIVEYLKM